MLINFLEKYPNLFRNTHPLNMCIPEGWETLVDKLCKQLSDMNYKGEVVQMKEKFGSLRFYTDLYTDEVGKLINEAEKVSSSTCEICGENGTQSSKQYWIRTLCNKCTKESK